MLPGQPHIEEHHNEYEWAKTKDLFSRGPPHSQVVIKSIYVDRFKDF
jgi:hypothetical protein